MDKALKIKRQLAKRTSIQRCKEGGHMNLHLIGSSAGLKTLKVESYIYWCAKCKRIYYIPIKKLEYKKYKN